MLVWGNLYLCYATEVNLYFIFLLVDSEEDDDEEGSEGSEDEEGSDGKNNFFRGFIN